MNFKDFLNHPSPKQRNLKEVYRYIHQYGPISKADLIHLTRFRQTTLVRMIDELIENRFIYESGFGQSSGGRPPILYKTVPTSSYIISIDLSRTKTTVAILDLSFSIVHRSSFHITNAHSPQIVLAEMIQTIDRWLQTTNLSHENLLGISIGTVGPIDRHKGVMLHPEQFQADGWKNVPIGKIFADHYHVKTIIENGVNAAALGEYHMTSLNKQNVLYCILGAGFRCGTLINGQIMQNKTGDASSYGHMIIDLHGPPCTCGNHGCLLSYVSFQAIIKRISDYIDQGQTSMLANKRDDLSRLSFSDLQEAFNAGDTVTKNVISETAYYYGIGIANTINLLHPEHVIFNGPLINEFPNFYQEVIETTKQSSYYFKQQSISFSKGVLQEDAVIIGASVLLFQSYF